MDGLRLPITKRKNCIYCKNTVLAQLVRNVTASGVSQVYWLCPQCDNNAAGPGQWIKHELVKTVIDPDTLPVIKNYSGSHLCEVCHSPFAEWHHWAPRHLFGEEADLWPTAFLCHKCHMRWHDLVTPSMALKRGIMQDEHIQVSGK